jgi:hypothetical protein
MTVKEMSHSVIVVLGGIWKNNRTLFIPSSIICHCEPLGVAISPFNILSLDVYSFFFKDETLILYKRARP